MVRQRKPRINLVGYENRYVVVEAAGAPNKWLGRCRSCDGLHEQTGREIKSNQSPRSCPNFKPHNWTGIEKEDARLQRDYGITQSQFDSLVEIQNYKCAICSKGIDKTRKTTNVDHCHETNEVRGILCSSCNTGLGHLGDNIEGLTRAMAYLTNPPFNQLSLAR